MATIKEILDRLPKEDAKRLHYTFEQGIGQFVTLSDGRYIGVNIKPQSHPHLQTQQAVGVWSVGVIKGV